MSVLIVDCKGSVDLLDGARLVAGRAGLPFKFFAIEDLPGRARWNPVAHGDPSVNKDRLMDVEEWAEPFYTGQVETALQNVLTVMRDCGVAANLRSIRSLLDLSEFRKLVAGETGYPAGRQRDELLVWAEQVAKDAKRTSAVRDMQSRLDKLLGSVVGAQLVPNGPGETIDVLRDLDAGSVIVFSLNSPSYPILAERIACWVARELNVLMGARLKQPAGLRRPTLVLVDELPAVPLALKQLAGGYQMAREAGLSFVVSCQSAANLDVLDDRASATQIVANARLTITARDQEGAELTTIRLGTVERGEPTQQIARVGAGGEAATGVGSIRRVDGFVIHPNVLRRLPDHHVIVHVRGSDEATALPRVCRVAPHHDHPLLPPPPAPTATSDDTGAVSWAGRVAGLRRQRWLPVAASLGGLLGLVGVPVLALGDGDTPAPAAPAVTAAPSTVIATATAVANAVMAAWVAPAGPARDARLQALIGTTLDPAPLTADSAPVAVTAVALDATRVMATFMVTSTAGQVSGWAITLAGPTRWQLVSLPVPVPLAVTAPAGQGSTLAADQAATTVLSPILTDWFTAWGRGDSGDTARLAALSAPGATIPPIGGLQLVSGSFVVAATTGSSRYVDATVTWDRLGAARYLLRLDADAAGTWRVALVVPWPHADLTPTSTTVAPTAPSNP